MRLRSLLQAVQGHQQGLERAVWQRLRGFVGLVLLKRVQALGLKHPLCLVAKQNSVTVKCDANFKRMGAAGMGRLWVDLRGWHACVQGAAHVA